MRRNYHFQAESSSVSNAQEEEVQVVAAPEDDTLEVFPLRTDVLIVPQYVPMALLSEYHAYFLQWNRWSRAFRLLFTSLQGSKHKDWIGATLLLMQAKMSCLALAGAFSTLEIYYDNFLFEFQEILRLAISVHKDLLLIRSGSLRYNFDGGIIPPLFFVATKCRDRTVRRQAILLLASPPWREGVFDSACVYKMAVWIMNVEEEGILEGDNVSGYRG